MLRFKMWPSFFMWNQHLIFNSDALLVTFPNSPIDSKFGFWNVGLGLYILPSFTQFMKQMKNWDFWIAYCRLHIFIGSLKSLNIGIFEVFRLAFIFFHMVKIVFQNDMWRRRRRANLWLNCQFWRKIVYIIM